MRLFGNLFEVLKLKKNKEQTIFTRNVSAKNEELNPQAPIAIDLSLRANGNNYIDRDEESKMIFTRISNSSSSVIGIAGVRGAGKSSLALNVLSKCGDNGYFSILIPSPTAYDPKEFLLTLYQSLCEDVRVLLQNSLEGKISLAEQARKELKRAYLHFSAFAIILFSVFLFATVSSVGYYKKVEAVSFLQQNIYDLERYIYQDQKEIGRHNDRERGNTSSVLTLDSTNVKRSRYMSDTLRLEAMKKDLKEVNNTSAFTFFMEGQGSPIFTFSPIALLLIVATILIYILSWLFVKYFKRRFFVLRNLPKHRALYKVTEQKLEGLMFQTKMSSSSELNIPLSNITSKFSRGKELETRPVSIPGLSNDFNDYLQLVAEVFGKVIICLDELDKIGDPKELNDLLKGIKGIIGQQRTHFLLTVSEDALAKFSTRFRQERDLLESSFEEIYFLNRININLAQRILISTEFIADPLNKEVAEKNCFLLWIFGNGIPREIKRNIIVLARNGLDLRKSDSKEIWVLLMKYTLTSIRSWALINTDNEQQVFYFLLTIDKANISLPEKGYNYSHAKEWFENFLLQSQKYFDLKFLINQETLETKVKEKVDIFEKAIFEIALTAVSFIITSENCENSKVIGNEIQKIFELLPYSNLFAAQKFYFFLKDNKLFNPQASQSSFIVG